MIEVQGEMKSLHEVRQKLYENITDEVMFIARASEGAISAEWLYQQPIFIRKKYVQSFTREVEDRKKRLESNAQRKAKR